MKKVRSIENTHTPAPVKSVKVIAGVLSRWEPSGYGEDCPDLPDFLKRIKNV